MYQRRDVAAVTDGDEDARRDRVVIASQAVNHGPHQHRRGLVEGLAVAAALMLIAMAAGLIGPRGSIPVAAAPSSPPPPGLGTFTAGTTPPPTGGPSPRATAAPTLPLIGFTWDQAVERFSSHGNVVMGDRLIVGEGSDSKAMSWASYNPESGGIQPIPVWNPDTYQALFSSGSIVVGSIGRPGTKPGLNTIGVEIDDTDGGTQFRVWPTAGFDSLRMFGLADGYAFGEMAVEAQQGEGWIERQSRAIVIDLARGTLEDLTPPGIANPALVQIHGVSNGQALLTVFPGSDPGQRPLAATELIDLASGRTSTPDLPIAELGGVDEVGDLSELRLDGAFVVGQLRAASDEPIQAFLYHVSTGALVVVPTPAPFLTAACPARFDVARLVCSQGGAPDTDPGRVFLYDTARNTTSEVSTADLTGPVFVHADSQATILIQATGVQAPLLYDGTTHLTYRLDLATLSAPDSFGFVGSSIVAPDGRFWRLP